MRTIRLWQMCWSILWRWETPGRTEKAGGRTPETGAVLDTLRRNVGERG
ncbi:MAG: hypothetical protein IJ733_18225 [Lachnospiraceae bacterium]|nr:hypothetical protein [Lachnospiraceae bacterium]